MSLTIADYARKRAAYPDDPEIQRWCDEEIKKLEEKKIPVLREYKDAETDETYLEEVTK